ncbi:MAG: hypothetical protein R3C14_13470 [Caldilineaceae bacterium]
MARDRLEIRKRIHAQYAREHAQLGEVGTYAQLDRARQWDLAPTLAAGGVVVFPHAGVLDCGHQIAAAVNAALDSGADRVVVISVLHAFGEAMDQARIRVAAGGKSADEIYWGIQGPGIEGERQEWRQDHVLISWRHFWAAETKRRGIKGPAVIERYPYLAGGQPAQIPGFDELARLCEDAVIVSTADPFHHGLGYGWPPEQSLAPEAGGLELARRTLEEGMAILGRGDYWGYNQHCVQAKSDARDAGQVFRYIRGPMRGEILDLTYTDATELYDAPPPTWVAGALFNWQLAPNA